MKKILLSMAIISLFLVTACGGSKTTDENTTKDSTTVVDTNAVKADSTVTK